MSSRSVRVVPEAFGLMTIDPGGTTAMAQGIFRRQATVRATLRRAVRKGMIRSATLDGPPEEQAHYLAVTWRSFKYKCVVDLGIPETAVWLAVEDFQLRQMAVDLAPVEVTIALRTLQHVPVTNGWHDDVLASQYVRPSASEAKTFATIPRMKLWDLYGACIRDEHGRINDHKRDAVRHLANGVNKCLDGKWS